MSVADIKAIFKHCSFNRYIVECKYKKDKRIISQFLVLIDT